jgi:hypothetical protein
VATAAELEDEILRWLEQQEGPAPSIALGRAFPAADALYRTLATLVVRGLVARTGVAYAITDEGRARLRDGEL